MHLRMLRRPVGLVDGLSLDQFRVGETYDLGANVGCLFLAEGWAELVSGDGTVIFDRRTPEVVPLVLVVDDDADVRRLTETLLIAHGYHVILAAHGKDAMQRLRDHSPDLIVLDLNMPVMNGWDFRAAQRYLDDATRAAAPVLVLSAEDDAEAHAGNLGAVGVVKKPFDPDDLLHAVSAAIRAPGPASAGVRRSRA
jgi:two-component system, OmpR family, alkaline phosphatase synthesis response regulator PhoP